MLNGVAMGCAVGLHLVVLGAGDDLVLQLFGHIVEIVAIASHANEQIAILVGMLLGIEEGSGVNDVELDVVSAELEVGADERSHLLEILVAT